MKTKMIFATALALSLMAPLAIMADDSKPAGGPDKARREFRGGPGGEEFKKRAEEMKALIDEYKANKTDENKAKIKAKIAENIDGEIKKMEERVAEMKSKRDSMVDERFEKMIKFTDRADKIKERGERKEKKD